MGYSPDGSNEALKEICKVMRIDSTGDIVVFDRHLIPEQSERGEYLMRKSDSNFQIVPVSQPLQKLAP